MPHGTLAVSSICCEFKAKESWQDGLEKNIVPKNMFFDTWMGWAKDHGCAPGHRARFGQRFLACFPSVGVGRRRVRGQEIAVYTGVSLTPDAMSRYLMGGKK